MIKWSEYGEVWGGEVARSQKVVHRVGRRREEERLGKGNLHLMHSFQHATKLSCHWILISASSRTKNIWCRRRGFVCIFNLIFLSLIPDYFIIYLRLMITKEVSRSSRSCNRLFGFEQNFFLSFVVLEKHFTFICCHWVFLNSSTFLYFPSL